MTAAAWAPKLTSLGHHLLDTLHFSGLAGLLFGSFAVREGEKTVSHGVVKKH